MGTSSISYFFKSSVRSIKKNFVMSLASASVLIACMLIIGTVFLISQNISNFMDSVEKQNEIIAFIDEKVGEDELNSLKEELSAIDNIKNITFVSNDEALKSYRDSLGNEGDYLLDFEGEENPLRNSFRIELKDIAKYDDTLAKIKANEKIASIRDTKDIVDSLLTVRNAMDIFGIWIMIILALVSLFIMSNTIKLAMLNRKNEINIMKYVGATNWFIRWPFILEGVIIGIIAGVIAFAMEWIIYVYLIKGILTNLEFIQLIRFRDIYPKIIAIFASLGIFVGVFGSSFSIRKYLKA